MARLNSMLLPMWPSETSIAVMEVPMLAPMMMGMAMDRALAGSSPMTPAATRPTVIEVVVDELWMMLVTRMPMHRPTNGFWARVWISTSP